MSKILVVDDAQDIRNMLTTMLRRAGYDVCTAANGLLALQKMQQAAVDLMITDLIMPVQEGLETIRQTQQQFPQTRIIAMSGGGRVMASDFLDTAKALGAHAILRKPFSRQQMLDTVVAVLQGKTINGWWWIYLAAQRP